MIYDASQRADRLLTSTTTNDTIDRIEVAAYTVPTDEPVTDGTFAGTRQRSSSSMPTAVDRPAWAIPTARKRQPC